MYILHEPTIVVSIYNDTRYSKLAIILIIKLPTPF